MKSKKILFVSFVVVVCLFIIFIYKNNNQNMLSSKMEEKLSLIEKSFKENKIYFFVLSEKRKSWWNTFLPLASGKSPHLDGDAVDLWVIFSRDIPKALDLVEEINKNYLDLSGGIGLYNRENKLNHMIHVDVVRGNERWGYLNFPPFPKDYYYK